MHYRTSHVLNSGFLFAVTKFSTLRASLSGTLLQRKDVVNQRLEFGSVLAAAAFELQQHAATTNDARAHSPGGSSPQAAALCSVHGPVTCSACLS